MPTTRLLVTGQRRSGTTLVANFLAAQREIVLYRDFLILRELVPLAGEAGLAGTLDETRKQAVLDAFGRACRRVREDLDVPVETGEFDTLVGFYTTVLDRIAEPERPVVGHKATISHPYLADLLDAVTDLKVIYVLRDPRDVVVSAMRKWPWLAPEGRYEFIDGWVDSYRTIAGLAGREDLRDRLMVVRYEDILRDPEAWFPEVRGFLGVSHIAVPDADAVEDYGRKWQDNSSFGDVKGYFDPTPIGRWRKNSPSLGRAVELALGGAVAEAGYELSEPVTDADRARERRRRSVYMAARWLPYRVRRFSRRARDKLRRMARRA